MRKISKYSDFLLEKVYLSRTIFKKYSLMVDPYSGVGQFKLDLKGGYNDIEMEIQLYGSPDDKQFILRLPSKLSHLPEKMGMFETIIKDVLYILNKNQLGYEFSLYKIDKEREPLGEYAILKTDREVSMEEFERIAQTTKIVNAKVKDIGNFDKMIYQTTNETKSTDPIILDVFNDRVRSFEFENFSINIERTKGSYKVVAIDNDTNKSVGRIYIQEIKPKKDGNGYIAQLRRLNVSDSHRGLGLGRILLETAIEAFKDIDLYGHASPNRNKEMTDENMEEYRERLKKFYDSVGLKSVGTGHRIERRSDNPLIINKK